MKNFLLTCALLLAGLAGPLGPAAWAQCIISPPPAGCPQPFRAIDVATGQQVQALCVGRAVRFELSCGRVVPANQLYYNALPGTNATPTNCDFLPGQLASNTYTPTAVGAYTIAELSNLLVNGQTVGTVYVRNFQVYDSPVPKITLTPCAGGRTVQVTHHTLSNNHYDQYFVQVAGGSLTGPLAPGFTTVVPASVGSQVTVVGSYQDNTLCSNQSTLAVPALVSQPLVLSRLEVQGPLPGPIAFAFSGFTDFYYNDLQYAPPGSPTRFRAYTGFATATSFAGTNLPAGLYRTARHAYCGQDSAFSEPVPTIELSGASLNNVNNLTWQTAGPVASYTLLRNGTALATLPATATSYADAAVACGTRYTYRLQGTTAGGSQTLSAEVPVQTVSALAPPAPLLNASFDLQNRVRLTATLPGGAALPAGSAITYSRQGGGQNVTYAAVPGPSPALLRDSTALGQLLAAPPCYTAAVQDVCGNHSATSPATCPSLLRAEAADPEGRTAQLAWSAFAGPGSPAQPATYRVLTLAPDGTVLAASAPSAALTYLDSNPPTDRQVLRYRVEASGAGLPGGTVSYSNLATVARRPYLVVPNAFTPNGDGLNDVLELKGRYLAAFTFVVVDRNGQEVFRATDRGQTWDGTIRGHAPVNAAYVWRFTMTDEAGQSFSQTGSVSILK